MGTQREFTAFALKWKAKSATQFVKNIGVSLFKIASTAFAAKASSGVTTALSAILG